MQDGERPTSRLPAYNLEERAADTVAVHTASEVRRTKRSWLQVSAVLVCYALLTLQFVRYYSKVTFFYLNLRAYLSGHERLPFQERVLPIVFFKSMQHVTWMTGLLNAHNAALTPERGYFYLLSLIALAVAALYTQLLYNAVSTRHLLSGLVYPIFLFMVMWSYAIHSETDFSYPYDLPSLAFFAAGVYYIYRRKFRSLIIVMLLGTFNRETTLFLIGIYLIDAASVQPSIAPAGGAMSPTPSWLQSLTHRFDLKQISWVRVLLLAAIWTAIKGTLAYHYRDNDNSENFLRISWNLARLQVRLLPAILNLCGYSLPLLIVFHRMIRPQRFQNYLFILVPWFAVMFCTGVLLETRIYGELCSLSAVGALSIVESFIAERVHDDRTPHGGVNLIHQV